MSELAVGITTAAGAIAGIGLVLRFLNGKIEKKVDSSTYDLQIKTTNEALAKGDEKFKEIMDTLKEHGDVLIRIDERLMKD